MRTDATGRGRSVQQEVGPQFERGAEGPSREGMEAPFSCMYHSSPTKEPSPTREVEKQMEEGREVGGGCKEAVGCGTGHHHHCQPDSWPRWLLKPGHLHWVRRSQSGGSSNWLWEAKPPQKEFLQAGNVKKARKYWCGTVALWEIWHFQKSIWAPHQETPLSCS